MEYVIQNLWKRVKSNGRCSYPGFLHYVPIIPFKALCSAAAYAWADNKFWYIEKHDPSWDIFVPCLQSYNY